MAQAGKTLAALVLASLATQAAASSLRPVTVLHGPDVRLSDLFDDAGEQASRVLGSGPPPGERLVIEAPQLDAIARQFGVDWRSASPGDHTVLERPGRPLAREAVVAALHDALAGGYTLPGELAIEIPGFAPPMIPPEANPTPAVDNINTDPASGRFTAQLSIAGAGSEVVQFSVSGIARQIVQLPVLTHRVMPGEVIAPADLRVTGVPVATVQAAVVRAPADAVGLSARRQLLPGQPIVLADLGPPVLVRRGGTVMLALEVGGLSVTAQGMAMESGGMGEHIHVLNTTSRAVVDAEVTGVGRGRVLPGAVQILPEGRTTLPSRSADLAVQP
jgi:flagella basal body P-ring formation protein FlgA